MTDGVRAHPFRLLACSQTKWGPKSGMTGRVTVPSTAEGLFLSYESGWYDFTFVTKKDMIRFITKFVGTYGYDSLKEFFLSVAPSFKYNLQLPAISFSAITAVVSEWIGITPLLAMAMLIAIVSEMWTGIKASKIQGIGFESFRFSRCIIKLCIWLTIIYITHSFYLESKAGAEDSFIMLLATLFFSIVKVFVMTWFCVEHVTSILENLAVIDGKPKDTLIKQVGMLWVTVTDKFKRKVDETER